MVIMLRMGVACFFSINFRNEINYLNFYTF